MRSDALPESLTDEREKRSQTTRRRAKKEGRDREKKHIRLITGLSSHNNSSLVFLRSLIFQMTDTLVSNSFASNDNANNSNDQKLNRESMNYMPGVGTGVGVGHTARPEVFSNEPASLHLNKAVSDLIAAIELLPRAQKSSFFKAKRQCPNLIEVETNPTVFLKYDNFNYWKAAERLAAHWTLREQYFGERAFLPMTQTGNGALNKEDIVTLHTGSHVILPRTANGQNACFTDRRRNLSNSQRESKARCLWYILCMASREESEQSQGILFMVLLVTPRPTKVDMTYIQIGIDSMNAMPATFDLHILNCVSKTGKWSVARNLIQSVAERCFGSFSGLKVITESCKEDLFVKLKELGCTSEGLPSAVGGTWKYEEYTKWCRNRVMEELYFEEVHLPKNKSEVDGGKMTDEHKKERTKSLNVIHSRQKRERRKAEQGKLEEDCSRMQRRHWALQQENARLEGLLAQARCLIQQIEGNHGSNVVPQNSLPDPTPYDAFSSVPAGAVHSQSTFSMQSDQMQTIMMNALAMQSMNQHSQAHLETQHLQSPMNQAGNQLATNQGISQPLLNQQHTKSQQANNPTNQGVNQAVPSRGINQLLTNQQQAQAMNQQITMPINQVGNNLMESQDYNQLLRSQQHSTVQTNPQLSNTTTTQIANQAGMNRGTHHFQQSRNSLLSNEQNMHIMNQLMQHHPVGQGMLQNQEEFGRLSNFTVTNQGLMQSSDQHESVGLSAQEALARATISQQATNQASNLNASTRHLILDGYLSFAHRDGQTEPRTMIPSPADSHMPMNVGHVHSLSSARQGAMHLRKPSATVSSNINVHSSSNMASSSHPTSPFGDLDLFASLDVRIAPDAQSPSGTAASFMNSNQIPDSLAANTLRDTAPRGFEDFDIPEPDPLPEPQTQPDFPEYQEKRRFFPGFF